MINEVSTSSKDSSNFNFLLFSILIVSCIFQGMALVLGSFPLVPVVVIQLVFVAFSAVKIINDGYFRVNRQILNLFKVLLPFLIYSVLSSFFLTLLFEGIPVFSPKLGIDDQVDAQTPLVFSASNIGQSFYLFLNVFSVVAAVQIGFKVGARKVLNVWLLSGFIAAFFAFYQKLSQMGVVSFPTNFLKSNTIYDQAIDVTIGDFERISGTFTESSYAGNCIATFFVYYLLLLVLGRSNLKNIVLCCIYAWATIITTSSIGYIQIIAGLGLAVIFFNKKAFFPIITILLVFFVFGFSFLNSELLSVVLLEKTDSLSFLNRISSDIYSFGLFVSTDFLGVGLGSNRPSSFLMYMLSNVGLLGSILFFVFISMVIRLAFINKQCLISEKLALVGALISHLVGKLVGSPDLNFWFFWVLISVCIVVFSVEEGVSRKSLRKNDRDLGAVDAYQ